MSLSAQLQSLKKKTSSFDGCSPADIVSVVNEVVAIIENLIALVAKIETLVGKVSPAPAPAPAAKKDKGDKE